MITIVDYGVGNLFSLKSSFGFLGEQVRVTSDAEEIRRASKVVLPGVGAFGDAADKLRALHLIDALRDTAEGGVPFLGVCLGMQLLFEKSYEYGEHRGLSLIPGRVVPMAGAIPPSLKIPQIGWNGLHFTSHESPLFQQVKEEECVYFVHSFYAADCAPWVTATTEYGLELTAAVQRENVYGCQFHPEKSGRVGLNILRAFCALKEAKA